MGQGQLYLPAIPPHSNLGLAYLGGLTGLWGSRVAVPASCAFPLQFRAGLSCKADWDTGVKDSCNASHASPLHL